MEGDKILMGFSLLQANSVPQLKYSLLNLILYKHQPPSSKHNITEGLAYQ